MTNILTEICDNRRAQVAEEKARTSFAELDRRAKDAAPPRGFARALETKIAGGSAALICEIKKASPSAGLIRPDFNPAALAKAYEDGGAACLSVLTESTYFQGRNEYLTAARDACALPALRKDFMVDLWQVPQSRMIGADCILLIMAALDDALAADMHAAATEYGMDVLIEVHDAHEMNRALRLPSSSFRTVFAPEAQTRDAESGFLCSKDNKPDSGSSRSVSAASLVRNDISKIASTTLIGINNRNLKTLAIDLATTETLVKMVPQDRLVVSESGLKTADDLRRMQAAGVNAFLIGESLMRQADVTAAVQGILP